MSNNYVDKTEIKGVTYDIHDVRMPPITILSDVGKYLAVDQYGNICYIPGSGSSKLVQDTMTTSQTSLVFQLGYPKSTTKILNVYARTSDTWEEVLLDIIYGEYTDSITGDICEQVTFSCAEPPSVALQCFVVFTQLN